MNDYEAWTKQVQSEAESLQRTNKFARKMYLLALLFCVTFAIITSSPLSLMMGVFFVGLLIINERLIWRLRKRGIR